MSTPSDLVTLARLTVQETLAQTHALQSERLAYSLEEAAAIIGIPKRTLADAHARGEFMARKKCSRWMVTRTELLRWLTAQ